jgi:hypothetical protein
VTHDVDAGISNLFSFAYLSGGDLQYTSNQRLTPGMSTTSRTDITLSQIKSEIIERIAVLRHLIQCC